MLKRGPLAASATRYQQSGLGNIQKVYRTVNEKNIDSPDSFMQSKTRFSASAIFERYLLILIYLISSRLLKRFKT